MKKESRALAEKAKIRMMVRDNVRDRKSEGSVFIHLIFVLIITMAVEIHRVSMISGVLKASMVKWVFRGMAVLSGEKR